MQLVIARDELGTKDSPRELFVLVLSLENSNRQAPSMETFWRHLQNSDEKRRAKYLKVYAPGGIRTHGLRIRNPALYPTELQGHIRIFSNLEAFCQPKYHQEWSFSG